MIELKNITKKYDNHTVLENISLTVESGEFFVLVGLSGSGKTTMLKLMNQLIKPDSGEILIDGKRVVTMNMRELRFSIGYVLQQGALFPHLTVEENLSLIPRMKHWSKNQIHEKIAQLMPIFGMELEDYLHKYPQQLSGGEKQRIGILRAIMTEPKILLLDEPFSALDPLIRYELQKLMKTLHNQLKTTIVFVTHDMREAIKLATNIGIVHQGKLLQVDRPQNILKYPADDFVKKLFESEDLI